MNIFLLYIYTTSARKIKIIPEMQEILKNIFPTFSKDLANEIEANSKFIPLKPVMSSCVRDSILLHYVID
jgi:hypothetical protein